MVYFTDGCAELSVVVYRLRFTLCGESMREFTFLKNPIRCKCGNTIPAQGYRYKGICVNCYMRNWRKTHRESVRAAVKKHYEKNKESINRKREQYLKQYFSENPWARLFRNMSKAAPGGITKRHLGCSREDYVRELEKKFTDGVSWDNYGTAWYLNRIRKVKDFRIDNVEIVVK